MMNYFSNKTDAVQFVSDRLLNSKSNSPLSMIIGQGTSEAWLVHTATGILLDDIVEKQQNFSSQHMSISLENIPVG